MLFRSLCFFSQMILEFLSPLYWKCFFDLFNIWFNSLVFLLEFMILMSSLYEKTSLTDWYQYSFIAVVFCILLCAIKYVMEDDHIKKNIVTETDAIRYLRILFRSYLSSSTKSKRILLSALMAHNEICPRNGCNCQSLIEFGIRNINKCEKLQSTTLRFMQFLFEQ